jgi:hypothetical protein
LVLVRYQRYTEATKSVIDLLVYQQAIFLRGIKFLPVHPLKISWVLTKLSDFLSAELFWLDSASAWPKEK